MKKFDENLRVYGQYTDDEIAQIMYRIIADIKSVALRADVEKTKKLVWYQIFLDIVKQLLYFRFWRIFQQQTSEQQLNRKKTNHSSQVFIAY